MRKHLTIGDAPRPLAYFATPAQSNGDGRGAPPFPPVAVGDGLEYVYATRSLIQLAEPLQQNEEGKGGPWGAFATELKAQTGRQAVIHNVAVSASAMQRTASVSGYWQPSGVGGINHYNNAVTQMHAALADLDAHGEPYVFEGLLFDQGGRDGEAIDDGTPGVTKQGWKDAFAEMLAGFRAEFGLPDLKLFMFRLGRIAAGDTAGWAQIRAAQEEVVAEIPGVHMVFTRAIEFPTDVPSKMIDAFHYTTPGYTEMGTVGAQNVAGLIA